MQLNRTAKRAFLAGDNQPVGAAGGDVAVALARFRAEEETWCTWNVLKAANEELARFNLAAYFYCEWPCMIELKKRRTTPCAANSAGRRNTRWSLRRSCHESAEPMGEGGWPSRRKTSVDMTGDEHLDESKTAAGIDPRRRPRSGLERFAWLLVPLLLAAIIAARVKLRVRSKSLANIYRFLGCIFSIMFSGSGGWFCWYKFKPRSSHECMYGIRPDFPVGLRVDEIVVDSFDGVYQACL